MKVTCAKFWRYDVPWCGKSEQSTKVFSAKIPFFTNFESFFPRKFSAIYTVFDQFQYAIRKGGLRILSCAAMTTSLHAMRSLGPSLHIAYILCVSGSWGERGRGGEGKEGEEGERGRGGGGRGGETKAFSCSPRVRAEDTFDGVSLVSVFLNPRGEGYGAGTRSTGETPHVADTLHRHTQQPNINYPIVSKSTFPLQASSPRLLPLFYHALLAQNESLKGY